MPDITLVLMNNFVKYVLISLLRFLLISIIFIAFIILLYLLLVYCVLIKIKFFRELLKEFGLPIPIEYRKLDKDK